MLPPYRNSRRIRRRPSTRAGLLAVTLLAFPLALGAQDTARVTPEELAERLRRAEEAIELLRTQLATQAEQGVQSASRRRVELFGRVMMNGFSNSAAVNNADLPLFALPGGGRGGLGGTIRQTSLGVGVDVARVLGGSFYGELHSDFYGGQQPSTGGRHFPLFRVRTAFGRVNWERGELLFGQEVPLVAGLNPVSVASFGTPEFSAAGNLWLWLPQLRGTVELGSPFRIAFQGAVLAPASGEPNSLFDTMHDPAERTRRPYLQARMRSRWGDPESGGEVGVGVHRGWLHPADGDRVNSEAVVVDARIPFASIFELRGEWYSGQALRGLGGGGVGQGITTEGEAVRDSGGWLQLNVRATTWLEAGAGCGIADPRDENLPTGRLRNQVCSTHLIVRPAGPMITGLTYRQLRTRYAPGDAVNHHLNLALGFEF